MKILGIEFGPIDQPLYRRLETLSLSLATLLIIGLPIVSVILSGYILLFTKYWWLIIIYIGWIVIDKTPGKGGRPNEWLRSWTLFKYARNYFPVVENVVPDFELDPKRNYLCAWFPHGFVPVGVPAGLTGGFGNEFRNHTMQTVTINCNFNVPFYREVIMALGACKPTPKSLSYLLSSGGKGKFLMLPVGGATEALNFQSGNYHIVLKNRKGFIKLALKNGVPVVPAFSFGENVLWRQVIFPDDSLIRRIQLWLKRMTNFTFLVFNGRGIFQYTFGILPLRKPINVVIGKPLDFGRIENPTQDEIDDAHKKFTEALLSIFNEYKYRYESNPERCSLIIE